MPPKKRKLEEKRAHQPAHTPRPIRRSKRITDSSASKEIQDPHSNLTSEHSSHPAPRQCTRLVLVSEDTIIKPSTDGGRASSSDEAESDWEEVEDNIIDSDASEKEPVIPKEGVEITLGASSGRDANSRRNKRKKFDLEDYFQKQLNKFERELQEAKHKVHLLGCLAHGLYVNKVISEDIIGALALSHIPEEFHQLQTSTKDFKALKSVVSWCRQTFVVLNSNVGSGGAEQLPLGLNLHSCLENKVVGSNLHLVLMAGIVLRTVRFPARVVFSFQPVPIKVSAKALKTAPKHKTTDTQCEESATAVCGKTTSGSKRCRKESKSTTKTSKGGKARPSKATGVKGKARNQSEMVLPRPRKLLRRSAASTNKIYREVDSNEESGEESSNKTDDTQSSDDDFKVRNTKFARLNHNIQKCRLSNDSEQGETKSQPSAAAGTNQWLEVYMEKMRQWICVDCVNNLIDEPHKVEKLATQPIKYVLAFDEDGSVKDVTKRYASGWMTHTRNLRVDEEWWDETLKPFRPPMTNREQEEDELLDKVLGERPLPTTISQYKSHPLYALKRHLLKFEGIYPPDAVPVGYIKSEPVYPRHCIHELHSRETWLKEARLVRLGQPPYKVVKARPKFNKASGELQCDLPLELYGKWQTEEYIAPPAVDGKVPRNDYGNVELFKPCMLPKGTVHLQIAGLNRIARKLNIDCAPAMIGWDFHCGGSHPVFDGWVVCEESRDILLDAWNEDQDVIRQRELEKREKRVYGNWRRVIRGLLIRERLNIKYGLQPNADKERSDSKGTKTIVKKK